MAKVAPLQGDFSSGEVSPLFYGRVDSPRYKNALATCLNYIVSPQGALVRRPGTFFVAEVKDSTKASRLVRFEFSTTQAYILEFGDLYVRFYANGGQVQNLGVPLEVTTPYALADVPLLRFVQSADTLYIVHPSYYPAKLQRLSALSWNYTPLVPPDGPYISIDTSGTTVTPSATSGSGVTLTATGSLFSPTDAGRMIRIKDGATWKIYQIFSYTSSTVVTLKNIKPSNAFSAVTAFSTFRLGSWYTGNYPSVATFHEDRLVLGGCPQYPNRFDLSNTSDYENFAPTAADGTVVATNAIAVTINSAEMNAQKWLASLEQGLVSGTAGTEWIIRGSTTTEALSPTNIAAKPATVFGSTTVDVIRVGKAAIHVSRSGRKIREFTYFFQYDGFQSEDLTLLAEHIGQSGFKELAYQRDPFPVIWAVRNDGVLAACTYTREPEALKVGWHRHIIGGASDANGSPAIVESVAVIPSPDGSRDDVWLIVKRYINGQTKRYVEYITKQFDAAIDQKNAFFVDCGSTYDNPKTITGATNANPIVVTSAGHGFANGDAVVISDVQGMGQLNGNVYTVAGSTTNTFQLTNTDGSNVDGTSFGAYVSGGNARKRVQTISGLSYLEGQTLDVLGDGAPQSQVVVTGGSVTLAQRAAVVQLGLHYNSDGQMLRLDSGAANGTAVGKTRRTHRVGFMLNRTLGLKFGTDFTRLDEILFNNKSDLMSHAPPLFSGVISENINADYDFDNQICWRQDLPTPGTILAVAPQLETQDR